MSEKKFRLEKDVKHQVKKLLDKHGWFWFMPPANGFGRTGISDFLVIRTGVFMAIETKLGKAEPSSMQRGFLSTIASHDGFAFVVNENNLDSLQAWLEAFDRSGQAVQHGGQPTPEDGSIMLNAIRELTKGY